MQLSTRGLTLPLLALSAIVFHAQQVKAQFSNRYPKVDTYRHHIYLEAFDFPFYTNGPVSPVASPDDSKIAFSAYGWIWIYDRSTQAASRITSGAEMDFLPTWSPDGSHLALVRDTGKETYIEIYDWRNKTEISRIDNPNASELDPYFSPDGKFLYFSSSVDGTFDAWRVDLNTSKKEKLLVADLGMEFRPVPVGDKGNFFYISKAEGVVDRINFFDYTTKSISTVDEGRILSQLWMDANTAGDQLVLNWSNTLTWNLYLQRTKQGSPKLELLDNEYYVTYPSWNRKGNTILFSMSEKDLEYGMYEVNQKGGAPTQIEIKKWEWGTSLNTTTVRINEDGKKSNARISIVAENGHFLIPTGALPRFDSQNGEIYFYADGEFKLDAPSAKIKIKASHGLFSASESDWISLKDNSPIEINLTRMWKKQGWYSGDHHFHLNYGGPFKLQPADLVPVLQGEDLDFATPMVANLHFQLKDQEYLSWERKDFPRIQFGQEVRSHFHGHIGLFGNNSLFWPWFWGPILYETRTYDDRTNNETLLFGRKAGEIGTYVHPISEKNPLANEESMSHVPVGLIADVVNGNLDGFEMACLWSDEIGSSVMYHQFLNMGIPVAITAGTDAFPGYARSMAVGTTRILVYCGEDNSWNNYLDGIRNGRSVVTSGPMIDLKVDGKMPGGVIDQPKGKVNWEMEVFTNNPLTHIELLVNGKVVWASKQILATGTRKFTGKISIPSGGWVAARVYGESSHWPLMDSYPFAHTSPIWFGKIGSYDEKVRKETAQQLLKILELSWSKISNAYKDNPVDNQAEYFNRAEQRLEDILKN